MQSMSKVWFHFGLQVETKDDDSPLTQADLALIPQLYNADRWGVDTSDLPKITRVAAACADLPAFQAAHPDAVMPE